MRINQSNPFNVLSVEQLQQKIAESAKQVIEYQEQGDRMRAESEAVRTSRLSRLLLGPLENCTVQDPFSGEKFALINPLEQLLGGMFATSTTSFSKDYEQLQKVMNSIQTIKQRADSEAKGKDIVLVVGNTGAGKSTLVNYLAGCRMREEMIPNSIDLGIVAENPIMEIGHGFPSKTEFPQMYKDPYTNLTYCDCPGFLDNRGASFEISNAYAIKRIALTAKSIKIVVLIDYHGLKSERAENLRQTLEMLRKLLGDGVLGYASSVQLLVSHAPIGELSLEGLKNYIRKENRADIQPFVDAFVETVTFYDPLEADTDSEYTPTKRSDLISFLQTCPSIYNQQDTVMLSLGDASTTFLLRAITHLERDLLNAFDNFNFMEVKKILDVLLELTVLNHLQINDTSNKFQQLIQERIRTLGANDEMLNILNTIGQVLPEFTKEVQEASAVIQTRLARLKTEEQARQAAIERQRVAEQQAAQARERQRLADERTAEEKKRADTLRRINCDRKLQKKYQKAKRKGRLCKFACKYGFDVKYL